MTRIEFTKDQVRKLGLHGFKIITKEDKVTIPKQIIELLAKNSHIVPKNEEKAIVKVSQNLPNVGQEMAKVNQGQITKGFINNRNERDKMTHSHTQATHPDWKLEFKNEIIKEMTELQNKEVKKVTSKNPSIYKNTFCKDCGVMESNLPKDGGSYLRPTKKCTNCNQHIPYEQGINMSGNCPTCNHGYFSDITAKEWKKIEEGVKTGSDDFDDESEESVEGEGEDDDE